METSLFMAECSKVSYSKRSAWCACLCLFSSAAGKAFLVIVQCAELLGLPGRNLTLGQDREIGSDWSS